MFYKLMVFLPLIAAIIAGLGGRWIGTTASKIVTTGALFKVPERRRHAPKATNRRTPQMIQIFAHGEPSARRRLRSIRRFLSSASI